VPPTNSDDLLADRYRLDGILGSGGMSEVHRAWDTRLRRFVAIKLFRLGTDAVARRRFDNEIRTLAGLSHPGLVSVYDAGASDRTAFVVLQLVNGRTLHERIGRGPMSPAETRLLGARLADALAYVHSLGVVHRDVKPSNILLDSRGTAYLADFGLARLSTATHLTKTGQMVGTAAYLAPEQVRGDEVTGPADIYALGLVLLECLTGQQEYQGTEVEVAVARLHRPPLIPRDLPDDLVRLLSLMTSLTPRRRPSAEECALILRGEAGSATIPVGPVVLDHDEAEDDWIEQHEADAAPTLVPAPRRASKVALIAAAATVLGISGVALAPKGAAPTTSTPAEQPASATSSESPPAPATSSQVAPPVQEVVTYTSTVVVPVEQVVEQPRPQVREPWHDDNEKSAGKGKKRGDS
jgi:serine/threonine protein kinase